ncbi:MAG: hypothetical protein WBV82_03345 [Myxococcaceae bacterium]
MREPIFESDAPYDDLSTDVLRQRLRGTKPERARAVGALARRAAKVSELEPEVLAALEAPEHRSMRYMGTISIAHIGVACLWIAGGDDTRAQVRSLIERWPEPDRADLIRFLGTQDIAIA